MESLHFFIWFIKKERCHSNGCFNIVKKASPYVSSIDQWTHTSDREIKAQGISHGTNCSPVLFKFFLTKMTPLYV
jgi:hypothetical protein